VVLAPAGRIQRCLLGIYDFADSDAVRKAAETLSHSDLQQFFNDYVSGVAEIPWDNFFSPVGLRVVKKEVTFADPGFEAVQQFDRPAAVVQVTPGSEAERAGLQPDDVLLEINGKTAGRDFAKQIAGLAPGTMLTLLISRRDGRHELRWRVGAVRQSVVQLQDVPNVSSQQMSRRQRWLYDRGPTP
jgi:predicted metalloprotease with PDZ domain